MYLELPEDGSCVSVVVVAKRDVLYCFLVLCQVSLNVLEEPRLIVQADPVDLKHTHTQRRDMVRSCRQTALSSSLVLLSVPGHSFSLSLSHLVGFSGVSHSASHDNSFIQ